MRLFSLAAATLLCTGVAAHADPVTYTLSGTFTGTIGSQTFSSAAGTITQSSDTSDITTPGGGFFTDTDGASTITIDGVGTATFTSPTFGAYSAFDAAGFYDTGTGFGADDYDPLNDALENYALTAPFTDTGYLLFGEPVSEATSLGDLTLDGDYGSSVTVTAAGNTVAATPEPSSLIFLATGLLGVVGVRRRR